MRQARRVRRSCATTRSPPQNALLARGEALHYEPAVPILTASDVHRSYGDQTVLGGVSLSIHRGDRVGLVGPNGAGKSTLARILAQREPPDSGEVVRRRDATVAYLTQEPELDPERTALETVKSGLGEWAAAFARHEEATQRIEAGDHSALDDQAKAGAEVERLGGWEREHDARAMLAHLGVTELDAKVGRMSGGERRRVDLARLLVSQPDLAILDEPTNHLDLDTIEWLENYLARDYPGALLLITHDRYLLDNVATRTLEIDESQIFAYEGGFTRFLEAKAERLEHEARTESKRQNFIRREIEWLRRSPSARSTKQKARIQRAESAIDDRPTRQQNQARLDLETTRSGHTILDMRDVSLVLGERELIDGLTFSLTKGARVGVIGPNGCGKTSLLRLVLGELELASGELNVGKNSRIAYFDQAREGLDDDKTVQENVAGDQTRLQIGDQVMDVRTWLARFLFRPERIRIKVGALSGGERARVALAKLLLEPANLLLFDEPTNDLDVDTLSALEGLLLDTEATALVVSHDRHFLDRVCTHILAFEGDGQVVPHVGGYTDWRDRVAQTKREATKDKAPAKPESIPPGKKKPKSVLSWKEARELEELPARIEALEAEVAALEKSLSDPALYTDRGDEVPTLLAERDAKATEIDERMTRWEALELKQEAGG